MVMGSGSCIHCLLQNARQYSTSAQSSARLLAASKWARPEGLQHQQAPRSSPAHRTRIPPRDDGSQTSDRGPTTLKRVGASQPNREPPATQRTHEEVRQQYLAKKQARLQEEAAGRGASQLRKESFILTSSGTPPPQRFPSVPTPNPNNKYTSKKAKEKLKSDRRVQEPYTASKSVLRKRKPKSAHLQAVRSQLYLPQSITVSNLSKKLNMRLDQLQSSMTESGFDNIAFDHLLTSDDASLIAGEFNYDVIIDDTASFDLYPRPRPEDSSQLPLRPPLVTIMGHVDHGKTTLLDTLRKSSVAAKEAGGITQHIGAFSVQLPGGKRITFLDTPGHAAFESMRQRGASVTDIVVLVVAADDSVMPQTREAIKHAQGAAVSMIVAINKMDKPGVNPEKVKRDLMALGVEVEEFGGDVQAVAVSGLTGKGLDDLENAIVSLAEILDVRAEIDGPPEGSVIESSVKKGRGNVATTIVTRGTLETGSHIVAGKTWCKVRAMTDETGKTLKQAGPGTPVEVTGWSVLPFAGDEVLGSSSEKEAKQVVQNRILRAEQIQQLTDIEAINDKRLKEREDALREASTNVEFTEDEPKKKVAIEVPFVIKADVSGSVEAIVDSISGIGNSEVKLKIIDSGVGDVTESDILRAVASNGKIIAFGVSLDPKAKSTSRREGIEILSSNIIYQIIDLVRTSLSSFLEPIKQTRVLGEADILKIFSITNKNKEQSNIAGCRITNGQIQKSGQIRITRDKEVVYEGKLDVLKHVKVEVQQLTKGNECGMQFDGFEDFKEGDSVQCYTIDEVPRTL